MAGLINKLSIAASVAVGIGAIGTAPALAGSFTISGSDYYLYCSNGTNTSLCPGGDLDTILQGNASSPGGNIELFASSETGAGQLNFFNNTGVTSISGEVGGKTLTLSSLTAVDWFTTSSGGYSMTYGADNLATRYFDSLWSKAVSLDSSLGLMDNNLVYSLFAANQGFARSSDANISYINSNSGQINIGLAGHYDISDVYNFLPSGLQGSEVVKYTYNGVTDYLYSFSATQSGQVDTADGKSHSGNYEVTVASVASVPEPSTMLGLMAVGGLLAASKKRKANKENAEV